MHSSPVVYPNNMNKYRGYILIKKLKSGQESFIAENRKSEHNFYKTFKQYTDACDYIKQMGIQYDMVKNKLFDKGDHYEMQLTKGKTMKMDKDDFDLLDPIVIHAGIHVSNCYASFRDNGVHNDIHRYIYKQKIGDIQQGYMIDHINGDLLDNRKNNLRCVSPSTSQMNRTVKETESGHTGVNRYQENKWKASIQYKGKQYTKCGFNTIDEALQWYKQKWDEIVQVDCPNRVKVI